MVHQKRCLKSEFVFEQTQSLFELSFALKFITALKASSVLTKIDQNTLQCYYNHYATANQQT